MSRLIKTGLEAGFVPNVHVIGDKGVAEMLDLYERLRKEEIDLRGFKGQNTDIWNKSLDKGHDWSWVEVLIFLEKKKSWLILGNWRNTLRGLIRVILPSQRGRIKILVVESEKKLKK